MRITNGARGRGEYILRNRRPIGALLILITLFMCYWAVRVPIGTRFDNFLPARHPDVVLYKKYRRSYGRAQTLVLMLRVKKGDIFNFETLRKIQALTFAVDKLPGVNHNEVFSLASYRVFYARAIPGAIVARPFMYPKVPQNQQQLENLRNTVRSHRNQLTGLVTRDDKGALIVASFNENGVDYGAIFNDVRAMTDKNQDANTRIYASGDVMAFAWGYHYLSRIGIIFAISIALMLIVLYLSLGRRTGWWAPILTGFCSVIWGLGFVGLCGFNFDPVMLVIPFILMARDLGHGIQWQGRYYDELDRIGGKMEACAETAGVMLPAGVLAVLANIAGIVFLTVSDIPALRQIGIGGAVWLGASLAMVFVFQPIVMSYMPRPQLRGIAWFARTNGVNRRSLFSLVDWLVRIPVTPGAVRTGLLAAGGIFIALGVFAAARVRIGYQGAGIPIYTSKAKINRDFAEISRFVPTASGWIVLNTPNFPHRQSSIAPAVLRMENDLASYLAARGDVTAVMSFDSMAVKPINALLHYGFPKYSSTPANNALSGDIWMMFFSSATSDEIHAFFADSPAMTSSSIRLLLPDRTYPHLKRLRSDLGSFVRRRVAADPGLSKIKLLYLGGDAGVVLATDDVLSGINSANVILALAAIFACCALMLGSLSAGLFFLLACVAANFIAFIYMNSHAIGLTLDTVPVISLGIGLGISYGIFTVYRIRDEVMNGMTLNDAVTTALGSTGIWVFYTFLVMVGGILSWTFSPLLFHYQMSVLLILLMSANLIAGVLILPALIVLVRPGFLTRHEPGAAAYPDEAGAATQKVS
ncbi:MAG: efflux RND transporter permease subunit [Candidatus Binataceae bacterium]